MNLKPKTMGLNDMTISELQELKRMMLFQIIYLKIESVYAGDVCYKETHKYRLIELLGMSHLTSYKELINKVTKDTNDLDFYIKLRLTAADRVTGETIYTPIIIN